MEALTKSVAREVDLASDIHTRLTEVVERQDTRLDKIERNIAWSIGALAVIVLLVNVFAPTIIYVLGLPH